MRRYLSLFLSVYVLLLTVEPCVDEGVTCQEVQHIHATIPSDGQADHQDTCSPFCTCSCCNISMEVTAHLSIPAITTIESELTFFCDSQSESVFSPSIWEPPKA